MQGTVSQREKTFSHFNDELSRLVFVTVGAIHWHVRRGLYVSQMCLILRFIHLVFSSSQ